MIRVQIMAHRRDGGVSLTTHAEATLQAAQEYAAHWTYEMIKDGFVPDGAVLTYLITAGVDGVVLDVVTYKHAEDAEVTRK